MDSSGLRRSPDALPLRSSVNEGTTDDKSPIGRARGKSTLGKMRAAKRYQPMILAAKRIAPAACVTLEVVFKGRDDVMCSNRTT